MRLHISRRSSEDSISQGGIANSIRSPLPNPIPRHLDVSLFLLNADHLRSSVIKARGKDSSAPREAVQQDSVLGQQVAAPELCQLLRRCSRMFAPWLTAVRDRHQIERRRAATFSGGAGHRAARIPNLRDIPWEETRKAWTIRRIPHRLCKRR